MREKKFARIAAFLLCLTMILGNAVIFASASDADGTGDSITDVSLEELRELPREEVGRGPGGGGQG